VTPTLSKRFRQPLDGTSQVWRACQTLRCVSGEEYVDIARREALARLKVDLLVPSTNDDYQTIPVPEFQAHAKGLPYLAYLLGASQGIPVLSSHGGVMVGVPCRKPREALRGRVSRRAAPQREFTVDCDPTVKPTVANPTACHRSLQCTEWWPLGT
jgi:hypothetical protein